MFYSSLGQRLTQLQTRNPAAHLPVEDNHVAELVAVIDGVSDPMESCLEASIVSCTGRGHSQNDSGQRKDEGGSG